MRTLNGKVENMTREFAVNGNHLIASKRRSAFTLIELLVVIAIIAILAGLTLAGVMVFLRKGPEVQNRNDILQLSEALQKFKAAYGRYPPSRIRLRQILAEYRTKRIDALDDESISFIQSVMWKELSGTASVKWAGVAAPAAGYVLEGDQCLVFFLGGPPLVGGQPVLRGGFSTNPLDPIDILGTNQNRKKYFDFEAGRLFNRVTTLYPAGHPFPSYYDVYGKQPFVYFSSNGRPNGYDTIGIMFPKVVLRPYAQNATQTQFYMPESFQLISAGADGEFGPGGPWTEATAGTVAAAGKDDIVQFRDRAMGIP
jgi:prepilin-type N-terminal cleavage/methylation domain-containing protein